MIVFSTYEKWSENAIRQTGLIKTGVLRATVSTPPEANPKTTALIRNVKYSTMKKGALQAYFFKRTKVSKNIQNK